MKEVDQVTAIRKAAEICGSQAALAERLGTWRDADARGIHPDTLVFVHEAPQAGAA